MPAFLPSPDSISAMVAPPRSGIDHSHAFDELCLVDGSETSIIHAGVARATAPNTLFLFKRGERHGYTNTARQSPRLWVIHYHGDEVLYAALPDLLTDDPARRVWRLDAERAEAFKSFHVKISLERALARAGSAAAESAWLRLLLVAVARWDERGGSEATPAALGVQMSPDALDAELLQLWQIVQDYTGDPAGLIGRIKSQVPNYDSLRHRFRRVTGDSPVRLWSRLRMHQARGMLLESSLSVKQIAARTGYARQHEFARAFRKRFGVTPTDFRSGSFHRGETKVHRG